MYSFFSQIHAFFPGIVNIAQKYSVHKTNVLNEYCGCKRLILMEYPHREEHLRETEHV